MKTLNKYRSEFHISQEELAKMIGKSQETISQYENGTRTPNIITAREIAKVFGVSLDEIFFGVDISNRNKKVV